MNVFTSASIDKFGVRDFGAKSCSKKEPQNYVANNVVSYEKDVSMVPSDARAIHGASNDQLHALVEGEG